MSIDRSLRSQSSLSRHRNVLTRTQRVQALMDTDWNPSDGALGLPKVAHRKAKAGRKKGEQQAATPTEEAKESK